MSGLPDPDDVNSAESFVAYIKALRTSLDEALAMPMTDRFEDWRGGWLNSDLAGFIAGMANWIHSAGRLPLSRDQHTIWDIVIPAYGIWDGGEPELRQYLADVEAWAVSATDRPEPWHEAAEAMSAAITYE
jgi:hypothetical protein